jgi:hypothetical protein
MAAGKPNVFIIESLSLRDEKSERFEGKFLSQILHLGSKESVYYYIRTRAELKRILDEFDRTDFRYLHLSCHGSTSSIFTTLTEIPFPSFAELLKPHLDGKRLFISACSSVNRRLAGQIFPDSDCYSIIGPQKDIYFNDAAIVWAAFYHLVFKENPDAMKREFLCEVIRKLHDVFEVSMNYYGKSSNEDGFAKIDWKES